MSSRISIQSSRFHYSNKITGFSFCVHDGWYSAQLCHLVMVIGLSGVQFRELSGEKNFEKLRFPTLQLRSKYARAEPITSKHFVNHNQFVN